MTRRDTSTLDLFKDYDPPSVVTRYDPARVKAHSLAMRIARAVAETMKDSRRSREQLAREVSDFLGETVTAAMLEAYASTARDKHNMPAHRLVALAIVTGDGRLLQALAGEAGFIVVPDKYESLLKRELAAEARDRLERERAAADAEWRARK
jgi:hypothetical protein